MGKESGAVNTSQIDVNTPRLLFIKIPIPYTFSDVTVSKLFQKAQKKLENNTFEGALADIRRALNCANASDKNSLLLFRAHVKMQQNNTTGALGDVVTIINS